MAITANIDRAWCFSAAQRHDDGRAAAPSCYFAILQLNGHINTSCRRRQVRPSFIDGIRVCQAARRITAMLVM